MKTRDKLIIRVTVRRLHLDLMMSTCLVTLPGCDYGVRKRDSSSTIW